jgi:hypothetical protein
MAAVHLALLAVSTERVSMQFGRLSMWRTPGTGFVNADTGTLTLSSDYVEIPPIASGHIYSGQFPIQAIKQNSYSFIYGILASEKMS